MIERQLTISSTKYTSLFWQKETRIICKNRASRIPNVQFIKELVNAMEALYRIPQRNIQEVVYLQFWDAVGDTGIFNEIRVSTIKGRLSRNC